LTRRTYPSAGRAVQAGCGAQIWGQTRCPICRSGTFSVQRSTLNVQCGDRKGVWWPGYGDRHVIWATGLLNPLDPTKALAGRSKRSPSPRYGDRHDVRYTDQERSTSNVQLSTFSGVTERAHGGWDMGTDTEFGRPDFGPVDLSKRQLGGPSRLRNPDMGTDRMSDIPIRNIQRETLNSQRSTG